ncbi:unnamed protein product [Prorocentrum cordatum]|uniref:Uncharacterized protein n=1 Tax=Prorocentrum cordatum TaxID=2364126 RepID=A0ABN9TJ12_9DINO|nr:unnamed protein product [Polarella glacialis]
MAARAVVLLAAALGLSPVPARADSPVAKVLQLLSSLETKVIKEGEDSKATFEKFAEWCEERSKNLAYEIKTGEGESKALLSSVALSTFLAPSESHLARRGLAANQFYADAVAEIDKRKEAGEDVDLSSPGPPFIAAFSIPAPRRDCAGIGAGSKKTQGNAKAALALRPPPEAAKSLMDSALAECKAAQLAGAPPRGPLERQIAAALELACTCQKFLPRVSDFENCARLFDLSQAIRSEMPTHFSRQRRVVLAIGIPEHYLLDADIPFNVDAGPVEMPQARLSDHSIVHHALKGAVPFSAGDRHIPDAALTDVRNQDALRGHAEEPLRDSGFAPLPEVGEDLMALWRAGA